MCLQNENRIINLGILTCKNGSSRAIFEEIKTLMDEYDAWKSIKMIICDTTAINTGKENGVVVKFQKAVSEKGYEKPQFIACQHHILDLVLRHIMDFQLGSSTRSPQLPYDFINEITNSYKVLKANYEHDSELSLNENPGWRDDFRFLYQLCEAFKLNKETCKWPKIQWKNLPALHNARWNSRGSYALMAYFLIPNSRNRLENICQFISKDWSRFWFHNQIYDTSMYECLHDAIKSQNCSKALSTFLKFYNKESSKINIPRTNIIVERAIKKMQEIIKNSRSKKYLSSKFVATNHF